MDKFDNVSVVKKANLFFGGKVASRTILFPDGSKKTLGIVQPGTYEFNTSAAEVMEVLSGRLNVMLPGKSEWTIFEAGQSFDVPANSKFTMTADDIADYCCTFLNS
jgi:uncharacterized protein YaiE (UPF0345 family)